MNVAAVFHAIGDPIRLEMVQRIVRTQPCTIAAASEGLGITRQGARRHLQILVDAQLAVLESKGRETHVRLVPGALDQARSFIEKLERQWDRRLEALRRALDG